MSKPVKRETLIQPVMIWKDNVDSKDNWGNMVKAEPRLLTPGARPPSRPGMHRSMRRDWKPSVTTDIMKPDYATQHAADRP